MRPNKTAEVIEMLFSERNGFKAIRSVIQHQSMDDQLRMKLWNALCEYYFLNTDSSGYVDYVHNPDLYELAKAIWNSFLRRPLDTFDRYWETDLTAIRRFYMEAQWYEVYDMIEFVVKNYEDAENNRHFTKECNKVLERELSAYRLVRGQVIEVTSTQEIKQIEKALDSPIASVKEHLNRALGLLADKKQPDFRNSIKESISAVEAICRFISGNKKQTLGDALRAIERSEVIKFHPSLREAFSKLYGFTCDDDGIRHALVDESDLASEDAIFMLVACSSFVNFLIAKAKKASIRLR